MHMKVVIHSMDGQRHLHVNAFGNSLLSLLSLRLLGYGKRISKVIILGGICSKNGCNKKVGSYATLVGCITIVSSFYILIQEFKNCKVVVQ